jgi:hypothetical protein
MKVAGTIGDSRSSIDFISAIRDRGRRTNLHAVYADVAEYPRIVDHNGNVAVEDSPAEVRKIAETTPPSSVRMPVTVISAPGESHVLRYEYSQRWSRPRT